MKITTKPYILILSVAGLVACNENKFDLEIPWPEVESPSDEPTQGPVQSSRDELYRPQIHYTPSANWINDPNGMVYTDGVWHLYYQYNPAGNDWGNMSWGHATSTDLMHWEEQAVAMTPNKWGDIFSGSAIVDKDNAAGFGANTILAFYTASGERQQQCLAFSTDGGITYSQYEGNPVITNTELADFRDPKVVYHKESGKWIMCLALGWDHGIDFWASSNLKNWEKLSTFRIDTADCNIGQWECPDLIRLQYQGEEKWVLLVSNNPGGPIGGSGTQYFVGNFNGTEFIADNLSYPLWLDFGPDNYAGVTWSNAPDDKVIFIGWMNNWNYSGAVPCSPWRSAMTLPRELNLANVNGNPVLTSKVIDELDRIAGDWSATDNGVCTGGDAYEMVVSLDPKATSNFSVGNGSGQYMEIEVNPVMERIIAKRNYTTGETGFHWQFSIPAIATPYDISLDTLELHIYTDSSSVEIISGDGSTVMTALVFPSSTYDRVSGVNVNNVTYRPINSVWK